jgi:hypothetical protein
VAIFLIRQINFLTDLYLKKGWSLRRISWEIGCSKATVRKKLIEVGIEVKEPASEGYKALRKKILIMRERRLSYQAIADVFNLWRIPMRSEHGTWYAITVRDVHLDFN